MSVRRVGRGTFYIMAQNVTQFLSGILFYVVITRAPTITKADIGSISTLTFFVTLFTLASPLGLQVAAAKYVSEFIGREEMKKASSVARSIIRMVIISSSSLLITALLLSSWLSPLSGRSGIGIMVFMIACGAAFLATMKSTFLSLIQGLQMFDRYAVASILTFITARTLAVILVIQNHGLFGVVTGWIVGEAVGLTLAIVFYHGVLPKADITYKARSLLAFSVPVFIMTVVTTVSDWADRMLFFAITGDLEVLGVYDLAIRGALSLSIIWIALNVTVLPAFSEVYGRMGREGLSEPITMSLRYLSYMIIPSALGLATISKSAMALLFGWEYTDGSLLLAVLALFSIATAFSQIVLSALQAMGETGVFIRIASASMITNIGMVTLLTPVFGVFGATLARSTMILVGFIYGFLTLRSRVSLGVETKVLWKALLAAIMMAAPLWVFETVFSGTVFTNPFLIVVVEVGIGIVVYGLTLALLRALDEQDFDILRQMVPRRLLGFVNLLERMFIRR